MKEEVPLASPLARQWPCVPGGQSARVEEWEPEQIMVQGSHMLTQGPCPIARKQQPSWNAAQRLPSPTWHLIVSVDCVKYQHSVNQAPFLGSKAVSQASACSHGEMAAQRTEVLGSALAAGQLWDDCRGDRRGSEQQAVISLLLFISPSLH